MLTRLFLALLILLLLTVPGVQQAIEFGIHSRVSFGLLF